MKSIQADLERHVSAALVRALGSEVADANPQVRASARPEFGDYQSNAAMGLAKKLGRKPVEIANAIAEVLGSDKQASAMLEAPEVDPRGFVNLRLKASWLAATLEAIQQEPAETPAPDDSEVVADRMGFERLPTSECRTVVMDISSPNIAKQLHVGHLRSTIIGDSIARVMAFLGHNVIRQNHVGDWGTQFGIILEELFHTGQVPRDVPADYVMPDTLCSNPDELEKLYKSGNARMTDPQFAERARRNVTRLQSCAQPEYMLWERVSSHSMNGVYQLYSMLGVGLNRNDTRGESFFNPMLPGVIDELKTVLGNGATTPDGDIATCRLDNDALCVYIEKADGNPRFKGPQGDSLPMIVQKSDGAFLYATTDLAALLFRAYHEKTQPLPVRSESLRNALKALPVEGGGLSGNRILYFVGAPQKLHFEMFFAVARALGWTRSGDREVELEHVWFGSVLGEDRKPLKTRSGENIKLLELLREAVEHARKLVDGNESAKPEGVGEPLGDEERALIARRVGIGAVKYADLCQNRTTDYVFSWDKMLAMQGNTAPYLMYAYARCRSIFRRDDGADSGWTTASLQLSEPAEIALAKRMLQLPETLETVTKTLLPNHLCEYLFDLAGKYMTFYENCPVLRAEDPAVRRSRLRLCALTARTLRLGLGMLGIEVVERM